MAKKKQKLNNAKLKSTSKIDTDVFAKGMTKDPDAPFTGKDQWTHCRNCINNSDKGDVGALGNEPANLLCTYTNYPVIGTVYLYGDKWILYSTDDTTSEIGIFDDSECTYTVLVNDGTAGGCLNFKRSNLITGASKENFDCTWQVYWDDGLNPTRTLNIQNIPWVQQQITGPEIDGSDCITFENIEPLRINCEALRIAPFRDTPRISLQKSDSGGQLRNGSYQVFLAYSVDDQKIGDWIGISNVQALWSHEEMAGSLDIIIDGIDTGYFEEFKLCVLSNNQQEQRAKEIGTYDIYTKDVNIDYINEELPTVPLETLPLATPVYEKSDKMYVVNDYLVRQGPTEKFDFNYQPLANQIETWWINTRFPADYYKKGGNKPTFMRDEVYSFFIRWIYKDGEKSSSYHIPGRYHTEYAIPPGYTNILDTTPITDPNNLTINAIGVSQEALWQSYNTAPLGGYGTIDGGFDPVNNPNYPGLFRTDDGGVITQYGAMGYWQSSEKYPNDPIRWNANTGNPAYDLCNTPIRHHKFPDEQLSAGIGDSGGPANEKFLSRSSFNNQYINILGVKFANIHLPRMNPPTAGACETVDETADPELVPNIVGYEILVGSRDGNKSIIAKGLARNMRGHRLPPDSAGNESSESFGDIRGVHANYPFNDLGCDPYLHDPWPPNNGIYRWPYNSGNANAHGGIGVNIPGKDATHKWAYRDMFTFHSPDTSFNRPYLSPFELKSYGVTQGKSIGRHLKSEKHPQQKLLNDAAAILSIIFGAGYAVQKLRGGSRVDFDYPQPEIPAPGVGVVAAPTNATALLTQQGTAAVTETAHTAAALGAPKFGTQAAIGLNTASGLIVTPQMWAGYARGGFTASYNRDKNWFSELPALLQPFYGVIAFMQSAAEGGNHIFELIYNLCSYTDYAFKYNSHGLYWDTIKFKDYEPHRTKIIKARYVKNTIQNLSSTVKMNNLFRPSTVAIITEDENQASSRVLPTSDIIGSNDNSRVTIQNCYYPNYLFTRHIAAHYCALKLNFDNQYGQIDTIKQIPIANGERGGGTQYVQDQLQILYTPTSNTTSIPPIGVDDDVITEFSGPSGDLEEPIDGDNVGPSGGSLFMPSANDQQPILNQSPYGRDRMRAGDALIMPRSLQVPDQSTFIDVSEGRDPTDPGTLVVPDINTTLMSDTLYGGDCYIARYTEKVTMPLFWDFLVGQPDGFPYDYRLRSNIMFPMFWANFHRYDLSTLTQYITSFAWLNTTPQQFGAMPSGFHHLDRCDGGIVAQNLCVVPSPVVWDSGINSIGADGVGVDTGPGDWTPEFDDSGWFFDDDEPDYNQPPENLEDAPENDFDWTADSALNNPTSFTGTPTGTPDFSIDDGYDNRRKGLFMIKDGYFYTHVNGVNDFFVETPMNIALRDWEDQEGKRHYDWLEFTDVNELFHANIQAHGNFYKYDQSLQIEKIVTHRISHGSIQPRYYDPHVAETCFTHYPKRLQYSLQAHKEAVKDYWRVYLPNNYKDFKNKVNVIKPISKSGAIILFPHLAPVMWQGVDTLQTDLGTKITIGDGGLFSQPQQNIVNADLAHEYGSCESSRSVINTPSGLYYISQAQGKIFQMSGKGLVNIADAGMKQWFNEYLPSNLIKQFPELEHCTIWSDNPVVGVGCQSVYDPNYDLVYFMKRDYNCISDCIDFVPCEGFFYNQTRCDGVVGEPCCAEGFLWNEELQECINLYTVEPITPELECPILVDIMISVDHSSSIRNNNNIENIEAFIADLGYGFFDELQADDVRISVMEWTDTAPGGSQSYGGPYDNSADVASFPYGNGEWGSTSPPVGFWHGLNRLYADGRPGVPKVLILVMDGYDASPNACLNTAGTNTIGFDCNICANSINSDPDPLTFVGGYQSYSQGWNSPTSTINTPAMENIRSDNPGEPGNLDFYIGNNQYGIYAHNSYGNNANNDIPLISFNQFEVNGTWDDFPGPYSKPDFGYWAGYGNGTQTGCVQSDNFIDWLNTNIFDATSQYQNPNHPDFDGELKVWGIWFAPWNGENFTSTNIQASTMDWNDPDQVLEYNEECWTGSINSGLNPYRYQCSNHPYNGQQITQGNIDYTIARSTDINHALWGNVIDQATIDGMVQQILDITCEEYGEPYCPEDCPNSVLLPTNIFSPDQPSFICACIEYGELDSTADARIPVEVSNSDYFEDVSWTVSYDPKAKAWISFHDWHPELAMPSLRHFLTTKTIADGPETCPPGTTLNPVTGMCESVYTFTYPAEVTILEEQPIYNDNWETSTSTEIVENACPWDIAFSIDNSGSTTSIGNPGVWAAQLSFVDAFVEQITDAMNAGTIQVGLRFWDGTTNIGGDNQFGFDGDINDVGEANNYRIDLTTNVTAIRDFLGADAWTGDSDCGSCLQRTSASNGMTNYMAAMCAAKRGLDVIFDTGICDMATDADTGLPTVNTSVVDGITYGDNNQGNPWVGSRHLDPNFTRFAIIISDSFDTNPVGALQNALGPQNALNSAGAVVNSYFWAAGDQGLHRVAFDGLGSGTVSHSLYFYGQEYGNWIVNGPGNEPNFDNNVQSPNPIFNIKTMAVKSGPNPDANYLDGLYCFLHEYYLNGQWDNPCPACNGGTVPAVDYAVADGISAFNVWPSNFEQPAQDVLDNLSCNFPVTTTTENDEPDTCICADPTYTQVYWDATTFTYSLPEGNCRQGSICRKVECLCEDTGPVEGIVPVVIGDCPDVYQAAIGGDWVNPNPPMCQIADITGVPPSTLGGSIWKHNIRCDLFANYYEQDYPWEIEWVEAIGQQVATMRSVEYQQESYVYNGNLDNNCGDRFHDLDWNFDEAIIHNTEQVSGLLKLNLSPKNNVPLITNYPIVNATDIDILYSKEEQKYRFNQFWDTTADRGEFTNIQNSIFITRLNGYIRDLNQANLNYNKSALERKKFRHYYNKVILRRSVSGDRKMILKLANTKINYSFR
jgi:hypothetical protein